MAKGCHNLAGAGTYVVRTAGGDTLEVVNIHTAGTSVTLYDNSAASGNKIATFGAVTGSWTFGVTLGKGLTAVIVGSADVSFVLSH